MFLRSRIVSTLLLTAMLASLFTGCLPQSGKTQVLTIAVAEADYGEEANPGAQSIYAGVKLAADQVNAAGGTIRVVVTPYADNNDPIEARRVASAIVDSDAVAVIGHSSIETGLAASDLYDAAGIPVLNVVPVTEALIAQHGSQLSVTYTVEAEAAYLANYLTRIDEKFSAGIVYTDAAENVSQQLLFRNTLAKLGGVVAFREQVTLPVTTQAGDQGQAGTTVEAQLKEIVTRMAAIPAGELPKVLFVAADVQLIEQLKEVMDTSGVSVPVSGPELLEGNELADLVGTRQASIVATNDEYGLALSKQFRNSFRGLGGQIVVDRVVDKAALDAELVNIFSEIISKGNDVPLFIAMDDRTAADVFVKMKRQGIAAPVIGPSSFSSKVFRDALKDANEEKVSTGYFTNGTLTTRALIFDSANRYANQFLQDYQSLHSNEDPGDTVVNGYDAVMTLVTAAQRGGLAQTPQASREVLLKSLLQMDDADSSAQGIASPIFFEPSRVSSRAARFGVYQSGTVVSANVQFEPIFNPNEIKDLQDQVRRGRIMTVNGRYVYKANVVYSGIDLLGIDEIDIKTSTYKLDFYLWFRYRPNERDADFKPDDFVFTNADGDVNIVPVREEPNADGTLLKTYRVSGTFKNQFRFQAYPFEHQNLIVEFRNQNATTSFIQYVVDRSGMRIDDAEQDLLKNYKDNGAFNSLYGWKARGVQVVQDIFPTFSTFGNPQNFNRTVATNYSLIKVNVDIQRDSLQYIIKSLLPLLITLILAYITFFLPLGHSERLAVGSTALLTTAFFHLQLADALPEIGYTVAMEYLFYASYIMSALMVLLETLSIRYEKRGDETKKKAEKAAFQAQREWLNKFGRIVYPSVFGVVVLAGVFVYFGFITLEARTTEAQRLADVAISVKVRDAGLRTNSTGNPDASSSGTIKLVLNTWRPEDSAQIDILLKKFRAYAQSQGQDIVIEHKPVVSINYDSILDQQLAQGSGEPDLFYVRPYSVDGSIAKYLVPLTAETVDVKSNYDENRMVPWTDRNRNILAVPYVGVAQGVYYNARLFREMGLREPRTWGEFLALLKQIHEKRPDLIPVANSLNQDEDSEMFMSLAANFLGGPEGRAVLMRTDGNSLCYTSRPVVRSFEAVEEVKTYLPPDAAEITSQKSKELFFSEKAVMLFGGSWDLQTVIDKAKFEWDVMAAPGPNGKTYVIFQPDVGIGINRDSPNQAAAQLFLNWLMSKEAVDLTATNLKGFYPLNKLETNKTVDEKSQKFLDLVRENPTDIRWMFTEISNEYPRADAIIRSDLYAMVKDDLTPTEAVLNLQSGLGEWYEPAQSCRP